jgi:hypothetical protein
MMARTEQKQRSHPSKAAKKSARRAVSRSTVASASEPVSDGVSPQRYIISNLISIHPTEQQREDAAQIFNSRVEKFVLTASDTRVLFDSHEQKSEGAASERRVVVLEADSGSVKQIASQMTSDTVIEPERLRVPAVAYPLELLSASMPVPGPAAAPGAGTGLKVVLQDEKGVPVKGATSYLRLAAVDNPASTTVIGGTSGNDGTLAIAYDPNQWRPALLAVEPTGDIWTFVTRSPQSGQTYTLHPLPRDGQLGWWQMLSGERAYDVNAGKGIKVGVIDSGVGPHPFLKHIVPIGAFLDGSFLEGAAQGADAQSHGTHVSGIIAARPTDSSGAYGGIAAGSDVFMARIFTATGGGNQGDVANAIDVLSGKQAVDIINMSLTGAPSAIEHDAVIAAYQRGTVCVCAAGNQSGAPVGSPAAYPECIAVGALGLLNQAPVDSMPAFNVPTQPDKFAPTGIFVGSFSNVGPQLYCAAPGNGIVSTVPARGQSATPYADMSGTSMSSPMVAGVLACLLAKDANYQSFPRGAARAMYAKALLAQHILNLGINPLYQGLGLPRMA